MRFQVHFRIEDDEFLLLTFRIEAREVLLVKMLLQCFVVHEVLRIQTPCPSVAQMTALMPISTMGVEFVVAIKSPLAEATFGMAFKATLVIAEPFVAP